MMLKSTKVIVGIMDYQEVCIYMYMYIARYTVKVKVTYWPHLLKRIVSHVTRDEANYRLGSVPMLRLTC